VATVDAVLHSWKKCVPNDFNRKPRPLKLLSKWKMREIYVVGARMIPALWKMPEHFDARSKGNIDIIGSMNPTQKLYFENFLYLTAALRIVSSNTMDPIPPVSVHSLYYRNLHRIYIFNSCR
jgi:hypothetical protein